MYIPRRKVAHRKNENRVSEGKTYQIEKFKDKAILRFTPALKTQSSIYFKKEKGNWKIDAKFMYDNIIYGGGGWHWKDSNKNN